MISFTMLKDKIAKTPILKHFDPDLPPVIVVYASKWAVSVALLQEHDGVYWPVTFISRTVKPKINWNGGKRSFSSAAHPEYRLHYVSCTRDQGSHTLFNVGLADTIFRP